MADPKLSFRCWRLMRTTEKSRRHVDSASRICHRMTFSPVFLYFGCRVSPSSLGMQDEKPMTLFAVESNDLADH